MAAPPRGNRDLIRAINRSVVLNTIKANEAISRVEISRRTGLSQATVSGITGMLIEDGLVFEKSSGDSSGGRRPILLAINPEGGYVVGIKLTENQVIGAITDLETTVISQFKLSLQDHQVETAVTTIEYVVDHLLREARIAKARLLGVGVGLAGIVDARTGVLRHSPIFGWRGVPLADLLQKRLQVPVSIDNDVNTLILTEQLFGAGQGIENFLTVTIGRGVGMGIVVNGQIYRGANGGAGEFGHTVIDPRGPQCACGKRGCLETYVADPGLLRMANEAVERSEIPQAISTPEELIALAEAGNATARTIFSQAGEMLGLGIANLINLFNPELIIISGEGVRAGDRLFTPMRAALALHVMEGLGEEMQIRIDVWEDDAWARGAASLGLQGIFRNPFEREREALAA